MPRFNQLITLSAAARYCWEHQSPVSYNVIGELRSLVETINGEDPFYFHDLYDSYRLVGVQEDSDIGMLWEDFFKEMLG